MKLVSDNSLTGILKDIGTGTKKALLIASIVPLLYLADLKLNHRYIGPKDSAPETVSEQIFNCMTCHHYNKDVMQNYERIR